MPLALNSNPKTQIIPKTLRKKIGRILLGLKRHKK
jgi:hypothetical protein